MNAKDIRLTEEGDLFIDANGNFLTVDSDQDHVRDLVETYLGHWKEFPLIGVGMYRFANSPVPKTEIKRLIKIQLEADNYKVKQIEINDEFQVYIDAERI